MKEEKFRKSGHLTDLGISYLFDQELRGQDRKRAEAHLKRCPRCASNLKAHGQIMALARRALIHKVNSR